jgi:hypothetical protein
VVEFHAVELAEPEALAQHDVLLFGDHCRLFAFVHAATKKLDTKANADRSHRTGAWSPEENHD